MVDYTFTQIITEPNLAYRLKQGIAEQGNILSLLMLSTSDANTNGPLKNQNHLNENNEYYTNCDVYKAWLGCLSASEVKAKYFSTGPMGEEFAFLHDKAINANFDELMTTFTALQPETLFRLLAMEQDEKFHLTDEDLDGLKEVDLGAGNEHLKGTVLGIILARLKDGQKGLTTDNALTLMKVVQGKLDAMGLTLQGELLKQQWEELCPSQALEKKGRQKVLEKSLEVDDTKQQVRPLYKALFLDSTPVKNHREEEMGSYLEKLGDLPSKVIESCYKDFPFLHDRFLNADRTHITSILNKMPGPLLYEIVKYEYNEGFQLEDEGLKSYKGTLLGILQAKFAGHYSESTKDPAYLELINILKNKLKEELIRRNNTEKYRTLAPHDGLVRQMNTLNKHAKGGTLNYEKLAASVANFSAFLKSISDVVQTDKMEALLNYIAEQIKKPDQNYTDEQIEESDQNIRDAIGLLMKHVKGEIKAVSELIKECEVFYDDEKNKIPVNAEERQSDQRPSFSEEQQLMKQLITEAANEIGSKQFETYMQFLRSCTPMHIRDYYYSVYEFGGEKASYAFLHRKFENAGKDEIEAIINALPNASLAEIVLGDTEALLAKGNDGGIKEIKLWKILQNRIAEYPNEYQLSSEDVTSIAKLIVKKIEKAVKQHELEKNSLFENVDKKFEKLRTAINSRGSLFGLFRTSGQRKPMKYSQIHKELLKFKESINEIGIVPQEIITAIKLLESTIERGKKVENVSQFVKGNFVRLVECYERFKRERINLISDLKVTQSMYQAVSEGEQVVFKINEQHNFQDQLIEMANADPFIPLRANDILNAFNIDYSTNVTIRDGFNKLLGRLTAQVIRKEYYTRGENSPAFVHNVAINFTDLQAVQIFSLLPPQALLEIILQEHLTKYKSPDQADTKQFTDLEGKLLGSIYEKVMVVGTRGPIAGRAILQIIKNKLTQALEERRNPWAFVGAIRDAYRNMCSVITDEGSSLDAKKQSVRILQQEVNDFEDIIQATLEHVTSDSLIQELIPIQGAISQLKETILAPGVNGRSEMLRKKILQMQIQLEKLSVNEELKEVLSGEKGLEFIEENIGLCDALIDSIETEKELPPRDDDINGGPHMDLKSFRIVVGA